MPLMQYKSGVTAPDGGEEWLTLYVCDWEGCTREGEFDGLCEQHFEESGAAAEAKEDSRRYQEEGE